MSANDYPIESMISDVSALSSGDEHDDGNNQNVASSTNVIPPHRLSLSETNLRSRTPESTPTIEKARSQMNLGPRHGLVPIGATLRENQELKNQLQMCRAELDVAIYKERESRALLSREVRDIIEEYYQMQLDSLDTNKKLEQYDDLQKEMHKFMNERDEAFRSLNEYQTTTDKEIMSYQRQIDELNMQLNSARSQGTTVSQDFTLASSIADPEIMELQQKLKNALEENTEILSVNRKLQEKVEQLTNDLDVQTRATVDKSDFVIGNNEREQELISKIDSLESNFKQKEDAMLGVIQGLLQTESSLKKKLDRFKTGLSTIQGMDARVSVSQESQHFDNQNNKFDVTGSPSEIDDWLNQLRNVNQQMKTEYGLDLNVSKAEEVEVGGIARSNEFSSPCGRPQIGNFNEPNLQTENDPSTSYFNASFADALQVSINAAEDVRLVKIKLETVKDLLVSMFERLRGSASVLDEVYKYLSSGSQDNRAIAEKIRKMKFELSAMTSKDSAVEKAVNAAEDSMVQLQSSLCVFEQTLNQTTSFIMETSRRYSTAMNQSHVQQTGATASTDVAQYEKVIWELREKLALSEMNIDEMKGLVTSTKAELLKVTDARDKALLASDSLEKKYENANEENNKLSADKSKLESELENSKTSIATLTNDIQELSETCDDLKQTVHILERNLQTSRKNLEEAEGEIENEKRETQEIKYSLSELSQKFVSTQEELERTKTLLDEREAAFETAFEELRLDNEERMNMHQQIELENKNLESKCSKLETEAARKDQTMSKQAEEKRLLIEESKENQKTVAQLENALDGYETRDIRLSRASNGVISFSRIPKAQYVNQKTMTDFVDESVNITINKDLSTSKDIKRLHAVYCILAKAIYTSVSPCAPPAHMFNMEINNVESASQELVGLLTEAQETNKFVVEQLDKILAQQELDKNQANTNDHGSNIKYEHRATAIDNLRYSTKLRQDFYWLTSLSADLTHNIKSAERILRPQNKVDFLRIIDDSRMIRDSMNERLALITRTDKENVIPRTMTELVDMNTILRSQNEGLHMALKENRTKLEAFKNEISNENAAPGMLRKIQGELTKIEKVMSNARESIRNVPRK